METLQPKLRFPEFKGNWERKTLKNICTINPSNKKLPSEFIYIDLDSVKDGVLTKENIVALEDAPSRAQRLLALDDVLFQMVRPYQKNNLYFGREGNHVASTGYAQLRANENPKFLFQYLHYQNFVDKVIERCTGSNYPAINSSDLANIELKITSLPEQTRIANFLSAVDEKLHLLKEKKALLEEYKKGMMQKIFNQELRFKDNNGEDFGDWEEKKIKEIFKFRQGIQCGVENQYLENSKELLRFIRIIDLTSSIEPKRYIADPGSTYHLKKDDLFMVRYGSAGLLGFGFEGVIANNLFQIIPLFPKLIINKFFKYVFDSKIELLERLASSTTMPALNFKSLETLDLPMLSVEEQTKIAQFLSAIDDKIGLVGNQIEETVEYKKGLLQGMFV